MTWRSVLFTPATRIDRVEKAWANGAADVVVADLEDATPPDQKDQARAEVVALLQRTNSDACRRAVRINTWPGPIGDADLQALMECPPDILVVPKAEDAGDLEALVAHAPDCDILAIVETAKGVLQAQAIADVNKVAAIAFGAEDLAADAGMRRTPNNAEVAVPRSLVALAAAAHDVAAIDMITADFRDADRFRREADEAVGLGYAGKMCLHPDQVAAAHAAWTPTEEEIARARRIVAAAEAAGAGSGGVVVVDGKMVDVPLVRQAKSLLDRVDP